MTSRTNRLISTSRRRTSRRSSSNAGDAERSRAAGRTRSDISVTHPRIQYGIQDVDAQVDQDIDAGNHQQRALDHRIVPPQHSGDDKVADSRQGEHGLRDDGAAEQSGDGQSD